MSNSTLGSDGFSAVQTGELPIAAPDNGRDDDFNKGGVAGVMAPEEAVPKLLATVKTLLRLHIAHHNLPEHAAARKLLAEVAGEKAAPG